MCQCRDKICINHNHKNTFIDFINEAIKRALEEMYNYFSRFGKLICANSFNVWPDTKKRHLYQNHYCNNRSLKERSSVDHFSKASHCVLLLGFCSVKSVFSTLPIIIFFIQRIGMKHHPFSSSLLGRKQRLAEVTFWDI